MDKLDEMMDKLEEIARQCLRDINSILFNETVTGDADILLAIKGAILKYHMEQSSPAPDPLLTWKKEQFKIFYQRYGKRVGRVVAERRWLKLKKAEIEQIMDTVDDFVLATPEAQYRPHPATYLAQRRWEDELPTRRPIKNVQGRENTWSY